MAIVNVQVNTTDADSIKAAIVFLNMISATPASNAVPDEDPMDMGGDSDLGGGLDDLGGDDDDMLGGLGDEEPAAPTPEDVLAAYKTLVSKKGKEKANDLGKKILAKLGVSKISEVAEDKRAAVITAFETLAAK